MRRTRKASEGLRRPQKEPERLKKEPERTRMRKKESHVEGGVAGGDAHAAVDKLAPRARALELVVAAAVHGHIGRPVGDVDGGCGDGGAALAHAPGRGPRDQSSVEIREIVRARGSSFELGGDPRLAKVSKSGGWWTMLMITSRGQLAWAPAWVCVWRGFGLGRLASSSESEITEAQGELM